MTYASGFEYRSFLLTFQLVTEKHQSLDEMVVYSKRVKLKAATAATWWLGFFVVRLDNLWFM
jgi:hypothetical protein